jgi:prepilin signal peptidase PulO-like enzyme (type II secretory pathway)
MIALIMAALGVPAGLALDALTTRFLAAWDMEDGAAEPEASAEAASLAGADHRTGPRMLTAGDVTRRVVIVSITAALFAFAGARFGLSWALPVVSAYILVLVVCAATDILAYRVPNAVTYPAILGSLAVGFVANALGHATLVEVLSGAALAGGVLLLPSLITGGAGMGMGDVKLAIFVGAALGFAHSAPALLLMALSGGAAAALLLILGARKRGEPIPYAPFISAGALVALLWQGPVFVDLV